MTRETAVIRLQEIARWAVSESPTHSRELSRIAAALADEVAEKVAACGFCACPHPMVGDVMAEHSREIMPGFPGRVRCLGSGGPTLAEMRRSPQRLREVAGL